MPAPSGDQGLESCSQRGTVNVLDPVCWSLQSHFAMWHGSICRHHTDSFSYKSWRLGYGSTASLLTTQSAQMDKTQSIAQEKHVYSCCPFNEETILAMDSVTTVSSQSK